MADWEEFENYIKSKKIVRSYKATLKTLLNYMIRLEPKLKDLDEFEILRIYDSEREKYDLKIRELLKHKGKDFGIISNFHSGLEHLNNLNKNLSEDEILNNLRDVRNISELLHEAHKEENKIPSFLNMLDKKIISKQIKYYESEKQLEKIVKIRYKILKKLSEGEIKSEDIEKIKEETNKEYETNILQNWKNFGICYPLFYFEKRNKILSFLDKFSNKILSDLELNSFCKTFSVGFDGPQNQGSEEIWFCLYNKTHKNQKEAKQIYFSFGGGLNETGIAYGLMEFSKQTNQVMKKDLKEFNYLEMIKYLKGFVNMVKEDIQENQKESVEVSSLNDESISLIERKKQIILYGPPGTGKTYSTKSLAIAIIKNGS